MGQSTVSWLRCVPDFQIVAGWTRLPNWRHSLARGRKANVFVAGGDFVGRLGLRLRCLVVVTEVASHRKGLSAGASECVFTGRLTRGCSGRRRLRRRRR